MTRVDLLEERPLVLTIKPFLTAEECADLIARSEAVGYGDAPISTYGGEVMAKEIRDNSRVMFDDIELAESLWTRLRENVPSSLREEGEDWGAVGLNERFRFYRYELSERFRPHYDGTFRRGDYERSRLTFMVYLNDDVEGGETKFYWPNGTWRFGVTPTTGKALVFLHEQLHEGSPIVSGKKYVLRSDVMYRLMEA